MRMTYYQFSFHLFWLIWLWLLLTMLLLRIVELDMEDVDVDGNGGHVSGYAAKTGLQDVMHRFTAQCGPEVTIMYRCWQRKI